MRVKLGAFWEDWGVGISTGLGDFLKNAPSTLLDALLNKQQAKYTAQIAQSYSDAQKALAQTQEKIAEAALAQEQKTVTEKLLSKETWKKALPYAIPVTVGLAIVAVLFLRRRKN